jgi:Flp pilus assembly protein TadG
MRGQGVTARETPATARRRHKCHFDRGAAAVEMALVMPLLILMVMGIIDFGRIFNGEIQLSQAAREGARVTALGAPGGFDTTAVTTRAKAALTNPAFQGNPSLTCATAATGCIVVEVVAAAGGSVRSGVCRANDSTANYGQVTITIPYNKILFGPTSLSQKAVMKCSG